MAKVMRCDAMPGGKAFKIFQKQKKGFIMYFAISLNFIVILLYHVVLNSPFCLVVQAILTYRRKCSCYLPFIGPTNSL